jgi:DsbC/DsbD-like thiol-disulfide interchange protein
MLEYKMCSKFWHSFAITLVLICTHYLIGFSSGWTEGEILDVETFVSYDGVHPEGVIEVAFLLDILPGWHINGPELADPFLIPCTLLVEEEKNVEVAEIYYPVPETRSYTFSEVELQVYEGKVVLGVRIKVSDAIPLGKNLLKASFLYQACDDISCMAPETIELEIPFKVVPASVEIKKINQDIFSQIEFR